MLKGLVSIILHAHLPYVRHPEHEDFREEWWFFEGMTECYVPLVDALTRLESEGVPGRISISLTPPLLSMMMDPLLRRRYSRHLARLIELAQREVIRLEHDATLRPLAEMYLRQFLRVRRVYEDTYHTDLVRAFRELQDAGRIEILASAATHGFLPLLDLNPEAVRAQMEVGVRLYERVFGRKPAGFWLPECGYSPGHDEHLARLGVRYVILESHGVLHATPRPRYACFAPVECPSGVVAFGRDTDSSKQVWSAQEGYPGDPNYREFYRDIGYDLDWDYVSRYLPGDGARANTGIKYFRITGKDSGYKEPYVPDIARERAAVHAGNFMFNRQKQAEYWSKAMDHVPIVVCPYDAELFGHWWFEGIQWLELLIRKTAYAQDEIRLATPSDYLAMYPVNQPCQPPMSSWGFRGYNEVWLEGSNDWIWRHLHKAAERMTTLARRYHDAGEPTRRALNQAGRELLLAQASDWPFILKTGTVTEYAVKRLTGHLGRFTKIFDCLSEGPAAEGLLYEDGWLPRVEAKDNIFPDMDYRVFG